MAKSKRPLERTARNVTWNMKCFIETLPREDQRFAAKGFRESEQMLADLSEARERYAELNQLWQSILTAANVGERVMGPGGPFDIKTVEAAMAETQTDIANLEAKIKADCIAMAVIMHENNFKPA